MILSYNDNINIEILENEFKFIYKNENKIFTYNRAYIFKAFYLMGDKQISFNGIDCNILRFLKKELNFMYYNRNFVDKCIIKRYEYFYIPNKKNL